MLAKQGDYYNPDTCLRIYSRARRLLLRVGWIKGSARRLEPTTGFTPTGWTKHRCTGYCLSGAIVQVSCHEGWHARRAAENLLDELVQKDSGNSVMSYISFNDAQDSIDPVLGLLDKAMQEVIEEVAS